MKNIVAIRSRGPVIEGNKRRWYVWVGTSAAPAECKNVFENETDYLRYLYALKNAFPNYEHYADPPLLSDTHFS